VATDEATRVGCIECDLIVEMPDLRPGENATCPRCGHVITSCRADGLARSLALAISALVLLALANSFPFMALEAQGLEKVMTLPHTAIELHEEGYVALVWIAGGSSISVLLAMAPVYLKFVRRNGVVLGITAIAAAVNFGLILMLGPAHGATGAAIAYAVSIGGMAIAFASTGILAVRRQLED